MVYIPFAYLLGLQAALNPFSSKPQSASPPLYIPFADPTLGAGSLLTHEPGGNGEPLNVIISGLSSPWVLSDGGFVHFANTIGFGKECLDTHIGEPHTANLGDGRAWGDQVMELRKDYGNPNIGSCWESPVGSNHLRMFRQNGLEANTGALFLAVSEEDNVFDGHNITEDGYNRGRDSLVQDALRVNFKRYRSINYHITAKCISGMISPGSDGINQGIAIDGVVTLLTITVVE